MQTMDITAGVRAKLAALGLGAEITERVSAIADVEPATDGTCRETITMGYPVVKAGFTRMKDAAVTNLPAGGVAKMLDDIAALATFLAGGMRGTPAAKRLELPAWVAENSRDAANARDMGKARAIAAAAAEKAAD